MLFANAAGSLRGKDELEIMKDEVKAQHAPACGG
jgi:hypothetical protein